MVRIYESKYLKERGSFTIGIQPLVGFRYRRHMLGVGYFFNYSLTKKEISDYGGSFKLKNIYGWKISYRYHLKKRNK